METVDYRQMVANASPVTEFQCLLTVDNMVDSDVRGANGEVVGEIEHALHEGHVPVDDVRQPHEVVGEARAHAAPVRRVPPVLHVAFRELAPRGADDVLPRQRRKAIASFRERTEKLRDELRKAVTAQLEEEMNHTLTRVTETLQPYADYVAKERVKMNEIEATRQALRDRIVRLRNTVRNAFGEAEAEG